MFRWEGRGNTKSGLARISLSVAVVWCTVLTAFISGVLVPCFSRYINTQAGAIVIGGILYWTVVVPEIVEGDELTHYWSIIHAPIFGALWLFTLLTVVLFLLCSLKAHDCGLHGPWYHTEKNSSQTGHRGSLSCCLKSPSCPKRYRYC